MLRPLALILALAATPALPQPVDRAAIPEGGQVIHRLQTGGALGTFTFRNLRGTLYSVEFRREDALDGTPDEIHIYDPNGNMVARHFEGNVLMAYHPHNCVRTLGECSYTTVFASGATRDYRRVSGWTADGWLRTRLYRIGEDGTAQFIEEEYLAFFEDGLVARSERRNAEGEVTWEREAERLWVGDGR